MTAVKFYPIQSKVSKILTLNNNTLPLINNGNNQTPFYYFVGLNDFSIVWQNVIVFAIAHLLFFYSYYEVMFNSDGDKIWTHFRTLVYRKLSN